MPARRPRAILSRVESREVTITLELRQAGEELGGRASGGAGEREFSGWLGLLVAIDALLEAAPPANVPRSPA
jgi:hypothetical protein